MRIWDDDDLSEIPPNPYKNPNPKETDKTSCPSKNPTLQSDKESQSPVRTQNRASFSASCLPVNFLVPPHRLLPLSTASSFFFFLPLFRPSLSLSLSLSLHFCSAIIFRRIPGPPEKLLLSLYSLYAEFALAYAFRDLWL
ncbi:hypothetical protein QYF36_016366 [Acer negundo]|nr:hypothetical protein QYF36_016366 [Acer negundo]